MPTVRCDGGDAGETRDGGDEGVLVTSGATGAGRGGRGLGGVGLGFTFGRGPATGRTEVAAAESVRSRS